MQFTQEELKNLSVLLQRVNLTGNEALAVAKLQLKVAELIKPEVTSQTTGTDTQVASSEATGTNEPKE